jgi:putative SOS response-associated peptidase YedK
MSPMCGRYRLTRADKEIRERFDVPIDDGGLSPEAEWTARYNIAPTQPVAVVRQDAALPRRRLTQMRWGLIPYWAKDPAVGYKMINARAESVAEKPAYRESFRSRRCLIPADGFYEWRKDKGSKQPFHFGMADDTVFAFAGLWDSWRSPDGKPLETCSILTTTPNALLEDIHDRMPVILRPEDYELWLDPGFQKTDALADFLRPFPPAQMRRYQVSTLVNQVKNDSPDCAAEYRVASLFDMS